MFNDIEYRSIQAILTKQNVAKLSDFENAYRNRKKEDVLVIEDSSAKEERIFAVEKDEKLWYLNSRYDANRAAQMWATQMDGQLTDYSVVIVFGLGDGSHIQKLLECHPSCPIIIYEPCQEVFWSACGKERIAELLELERIFLAVKGICENLFVVYLETFIKYENYQMVKNCILPNYKQLFLDEYRWHMDKYLYVVKRILFNRNTEIIFSKEIISNMMNLSKDVIEQYSVVQLEDILVEKKLENMAAVLVAAGPSLDKNIEKLKKIKDNLFIMVVDTALNTALKHGIIPDMTISVDGHKPMVLFEDERVKRIPIALSTQSNQKVVAKSEAMRFYEIKPGEYLGELYHEINKRVDALPTGGSVANNALALLVKMGFKTIIFMGLDLAYPGGLQHSYDAYHKEDKLNQAKKYIEIDDIYGNKVLTESNMQLYLNWFEAYISVMPHICFIDATEGGALIRGTELRTMDEVAEELESAVYEKELIWENLSTYLSEKEQEILKEKIKSIPMQLEKLEQKISKGLKNYDKMDELNRKSNGMSASLGKMLDEVSALNEYMDNNPVVGLVRFYAMQEDYEVKGNILRYNEKASAYEQIKDVIKNGRILLNGYLQGVNELKKDIDLFLECW